MKVRDWVHKLWQTKEPHDNTPVENIGFADVSALSYEDVDAMLDLELKETTTQEFVVNAKVPVWHGPFSEAIKMRDVLRNRGEECAVLRPQQVELPIEQFDKEMYVLFQPGGKNGLSRVYSSNGHWCLSDLKTMEGTVE